MDRSFYNWSHWHFAGQTFTCSRAGLLDNIQLYSLAVYSPGNVDLTLHEFDNGNKTWGPAIACCSRLIQKDDEARWIRFDPGPVLLTKDETYGFRVQTTDALIGFGEAVTSNKYPFSFGHEWNGNSGNKKGYFLSYFSLAFKIELCEWKANLAVVLLTAGSFSFLILKYHLK